ncbi:MAG TPA: saccharopine dehydrogenase C-terminal domain-containing protein [Vicinamibacteria bacterium]|nr:saccharopine dehydrogenase C-terminal domain-containing protein [Vicinamibacteria bacterium]
MPYRCVILGSGRQGTAAACDLVRYGGAGRVVMADAHLDSARRAAERVNDLAGRDVAEATAVYASEARSVKAVVDGAQVALSAVPYFFNLGIAEACIACGVSLCDLGGNTDVVWSQLGLDEAARARGVSVVPDCGMGPGLVNHMGVYVMDLLDQPREVYLYDGGLPQDPRDPWRYELTFHINGLTNEYDGDATFIRDGKLTKVPTFTELETVEIPPLGTLEAFVISGSMSTTPHTHLGRLVRYENKVLRYPGHFATFEAYKRLGLFSEVAVEVDGQAVVPRSLYHRLLEPMIAAQAIRDVCVMRAVGVGEKDSRPARVTVDLVDRYDPATGFTAMERLTGGHAAIVMGLQASGRVPPGAHRMEQAIPAAAVMAELTRRGIPHTTRWEEGPPETKGA